MLIIVEQSNEFKFQYAGSVREFKHHIPHNAPLNHQRSPGSLTSWVEQRGKHWKKSAQNSMAAAYIFHGSNLLVIAFEILLLQKLMEIEQKIDLIKPT